jgi:hypothetical protein
MKGEKYVNIFFQKEEYQPEFASPSSRNETVKDVNVNPMNKDKIVSKVWRELLSLSWRMMNTHKQSSN